MIIPLDDCLHHLDTITQWVWDEWHGGQNGHSFDETRAVMRGKPSAPPTLVALDELTRRPVGVLGFRRVILQGRDPLVLFINSLFVVRHARRHGVASALLAEAMRRVSAADEWIYVYTHIASWYEARGFSAVERDATTGNSVLRRAVADRTFAESSAVITRGQ